MRLLEACLLLLPFAGSAIAQQSAGRPNILFLMSDQFRHDYMGRVWNGSSLTPNIDRIAAAGARFSRAYSSTPTCTPARAAILTGLSPWNHGMLGYGTVAPRYAHELPRLMDGLNYTTAIIGKNHFILDNDTVPSHGYEQLSLYDGLGNGLPNGQEFDTYDAWFQAQLPGANPLLTGGLDWNSWNGAPYVYNETLHPTAWTGNLAVQWLQAAASRRASAASASAAAQPFFLKVSFHRPHSPYDPPQRWLDATPAEALMPLHVNASWDLRYRGGAGDPPGCGPSDADAWCGAMPDANLTLGRRGYLANLRFVDEWVGHILDALQATGAGANTLIVFVSDHGDGHGDHYLFRKMYPLEISAHVPMLLAWPESFNASVPRGVVLDNLAELRDLLPTFLDAAGAWPLPNASFDGQPLTCLLRAPPASRAADCAWRGVLDLEHDICFNVTQHWNAVTDGEMKYIFHAFWPREQLFNVTADPYEMEDLAPLPQYEAVLEQWRGVMVAQFEREGRGDAWVKNGTLQQRVTGQLYSPNYPGPTAHNTGVGAMMM